MFFYYATVCSGLESIAAVDIQERLGKVEWAEERLGKVFFEYNGPAQKILGLRSVNNVYGLILERDDLPLEREGLSWLMDLARNTSLEMALKSLAEVRGWREGMLEAPTFRVSAERSGQHDYTSPEIEAALGAGFVDRYKWPADMKNFAIQICAEVQDQHLTLGIKIVDRLQHRHLVARGPTSLNSAAAWAMCWLSEPAPGLVWIDPMCGSGTIPIEAALEWPDMTYLAGDVGNMAMALSRRNIAHSRTPVHIFQWNTRRLPFADASIDRIVTDLPWGRRIGSHSSNLRLYPSYLREFARVIKPDGLIVLMTLERRLMQKCLNQRKELALERQIPVNIGGANVVLYVLRKQD